MAQNSKSYKYLNQQFASLFDVDGRSVERDNFLSFDKNHEFDQRASVQALSGCRSTLDFILESLSQAIGIS